MHCFCFVIKEQREKELMLRQNSMEHTFQNEDYKSEEETELGFCTDEESLHTVVGLVRDLI